MTGWDIRPSEVGGVLGKVATAAEGLAKAGEGVQKTLPSAAAAAGTISGMYCGPAPTGPVAAALAEFGNKWGRDLIYVAKRTANSLNGAAEATRKYVEGDLELAANAQHKALAEPRIDMPGQGKK
ncbi:DUF6507 family protein [Streptomyces sp. SCA3-4]|uniref:DUF6507 family protein n=1 Tax=Streptomyces sichuanensis TaxID=2871810 RepID=UPI001CE3333E|nr:DUF6507 family protein [Streptomyces sichuanensis]MCA6094090.1 DUF6507 family protein [Streptomyces sichuanensis]